ncbi:SRPBCC family protein [Haloarchaeobius amylolyticus]|uniref:SRPBCC family protein n=1 Tax=Haloarchaeobius amylolyticus TaxID=1198296 RepID=UPI002270BED7
MERIEVTTVVYLPPEEVYEFLLDFPRYARYSKYLKDVGQDGDGGPGTRYDLHFAWWKLTYTARSEVTGVEPPNVIDWKIIKDIDATGQWHVESVPEQAPDEDTPASEVTFLVTYDPESAHAGNIDIPRFVSLAWVIEKVKPKVKKEAQRIVERIVADLEGQRRSVDLEITTAVD